MDLNQINFDDGASSSTHDDVKLKEAAAAALNRGDLDRAETLYRNLLIYERELHGDEFPGQLGILSILVRILVLRGDIHESITWLEKALVINAACFGASSPETAQAMINLAGVLRKSEDASQNEEAEQIYLQAIEILYRLHGSDGHADIATSILGMGMCIERIGRLQDSRQLYEDAVSMRRKHLGLNHADTGDALLCLATLLSRTWETAVAMVRYEQAITVFRMAYGAQHPRVELVRDSLSTLFRRQAKEQWDQSLYGEACVSSMAADRRVLGNAIVSGYFYRKEKGVMGMGTVKKRLFAAIFPCVNADSGSEEADGTVLLWAYDADLSSQGRALPGVTMITSVWRAIQPAHTRTAKTGSELYGQGFVVELSVGAETKVVHEAESGRAGSAHSQSHCIFSIIVPQHQGIRIAAVELFHAWSESEAPLSAWNEAVVTGRVVEES